jgi:hypothetical protein
MAILYEMLSAIRVASSRVTSIYMDPIPNSKLPTKMKSERVHTTSSVNCMAISNKINKKYCAK